MSTSLTHAFVGGTIGLWGKVSVSRPKLAITLAVLAVLPDIDVLSIPLGLSQDQMFGHRGFSHSLAFAALVGLVAPTVVFRRVPRFSREWWNLCGICSLAIASHILLDGLTYLAGGVAVWAPFDATRYTFSWRPLPPPPLAVGHIQSYFTPGLIMTELSRVWLPAGSIAALFWIARRLRSRLGTSGQSVSNPERTRQDGDGGMGISREGRPARRLPVGVSLGCIAVVGLCVFLKPEAVSEIAVDSITYRGVSSGAAETLASEVRREMERRHAEVLHSALLHWDLVIDEDPPFRHRFLQDTNDRRITGRGTTTGNLPVPLEYRVRVRPVARRPDLKDSAGVAIDVEIEFNIERRHETAARLMQEVIRERILLLFCHELDESARERGVALILKDWSDDSLAILPGGVGMR